MKGNTTNLTGNWGNLNAPVYAIATDTMATGCVSFCFQENEQQVRELAVCGLPNQGAKGNRSSLVHFTVVELLCTTGWSRPKLTAAMQRTLQHTLLCFTGFITLTLCEDSMTLTLIIFLLQKKPEPRDTSSHWSSQDLTRSITCRTVCSPHISKDRFPPLAHFVPGGFTLANWTFAIQADAESLARSCPPLCQSPLFWT